jgi:hypothetical protein
VAVHGRRLQTKMLLKLANKSKVTYSSFSFCIQVF